MSKPTESEAQAAIEAAGRLPLPRDRAELAENYPPLKVTPEATLIYGYRNAPKRSRSDVRITQKALERLRTAVVDESGLAYGEPISEGRTDGRRRSQ